MSNLSCKIKLLHLVASRLILKTPPFLIRFWRSNFEFPLITKAGARIEVLLNATARRNEHGKVIGVVGIGQDITGETRLSYRLDGRIPHLKLTAFFVTCSARLAQEREYSKLIDNANAPIFGVDNQGRVNVWNKCARKLVGYALDEVYVSHC